jgi:CubicO group peptidase (beta-lactamase class C family)
MNRVHSAALLALLGLAPLAAQQAAPDPAVYRTLVEQAFAAFRPVGLAVAIVEGGQVVLEIGLGERVAGGGEPVTARTPFNIASCTKAFTAAAVGKLVAAGRLGWDDPVIDHVPEFRLSDPWITRNLTVRDLLCHRSGLRTFAGDLLWYESDYGDDEVLARAARLPIERRFREEFGYQNILYMVAGRVVERVAGVGYADFLRDAFFAPLGMDGTAVGFEALPDDPAPAMPHIGGAAIGVVEFRACRPAGAIWSSVHDMSAWVRMLLAGGRFGDRELLAEEVLAAAWRPHTSMASGRTAAAIEDFNAYGLGWFVSVQDGKKLVEHDGGMPGFLSKVTLVPADGFGMVVLNNTDDGVLNLALRRAVLAERAGGDGAALLTRFAEFGRTRREAAAAEQARREAARVGGTSPTLALDAYAGRYEDAILGPAEIVLDEGVLRLRVLPSARALQGALRHWHHDVFRVDFPDRFLPFALLRFTLDVDGAVEGFRIDCPIDDFDFAALDFRRTGK